MLQQIGYLWPEVQESSGIQRFMGHQMIKYVYGTHVSSLPKNKVIDGASFFQLKKGRGRPKRIEVPFEDI